MINTIPFHKNVHYRIDVTSKSNHLIEDFAGFFAPILTLVLNIFETVNKCYQPT